MKDKPNITSPHDKLVKDLLADTQLARAFLEEMLPEEVVELLDLPTLTHKNTSYLTPQMDEISSDVVLEVYLKNTQQPLQISLLIEHKSYKDMRVSFQLLRYLAEGYGQQLKNKQPLYPIIPLLFYHGQKRWKLRQIEAFFGQYPETIRRFVPSFEVEFVNLMQMPEEQLEQLRDGVLSATLRLLRHSRDWSSLLERLPRIMESLSGVQGTGFVMSLFVYLFSVTELTVAQLKESLPQETQKTFMSTYDRIMAEGIAKGKAEGIEKGKAEGIAEGIEKGIEKAVLNAFDNGIAMDTIRIITGESIEKIEQILKNNKRK